MDAALRFRRRHALHAVRARLELEPRVSALTGDLGDDFAIAAEVGGVLRDDFHLPAIAFGEPAVHAEEIAGEQRRLVAAGTRADFEKDVPLVVGILGQQLLLQIHFQRRETVARRADFVFRESAHFGIGRHFLGDTDVVLALAIGAIEFDHRLDLRVFAREPAIRLHVVGHVFGRKQTIQFIEAGRELRELRSNTRFHRNPGNETGRRAGYSGACRR